MIEFLTKWGAILVSAGSLAIAVMALRASNRNAKAAIPRPDIYEYGGTSIRIAIRPRDCDLYGISEVRRSDRKDVVRMDPLSIESAARELQFGIAASGERIKFDPPVGTAIVRKDPFDPGETWEVKVVSLGADGISRRFNVEPI